MIIGANVECASTPVGICAERCALGKAKVSKVGCFFFLAYCCEWLGLGGGEGGEGGGRRGEGGGFDIGRYWKLMMIA